MMNVVVSLDHRFRRTPDGAIWTYGTLKHAFWNRYLDVFSGVKVVARVREVEDVPRDYHRVDGGGVGVIGIPYFVGPRDYLLRLPAILRILRGAIARDDAVILRVPSTISSTVYRTLRRTEHPYSVEVVGDPDDAFAPGAVRHPLRPLFRLSFTRALRTQCRHSSAASYVTAMALQRKYPPRVGTFATHYSDVELPDDAFAKSPRVAFGMTPFRLAFVGTLEQLYKAPDVLISAVARCVSQGLDLRLVMIGDGHYRGYLANQARRLGIGDRVTFLGYLRHGPAVWEQLDKADLFVLPSRTEGLPRALVEAMARALPCIGTTAGGIPELLVREDLVTPGDPRALADKIQEVATTPTRLVRMSQRNLETAHGYKASLLQRRRIEFYQHVRTITAHWVGTSL